MWIFGLKGLTKFCVFDLYTVIIYDLITIVRYSKPEAGTTERERERERERPWLGLVMWLQNKINSEGGVLCLTILCLVHAMIAKVRKGKTYNYI